MTGSNMQAGYCANQSNALIEAAYTLRIDEMRVVLIALSKLDSRQKSNEENIKGTITPSEYVALTGDKSNTYKSMYMACISLMSNPIFIFEAGSKPNSKGKTKLRNWFEAIDYCHDTSKIDFKFSDYVIEHIFDLKGNFTQVKIKYALSLKSVFSIRLFTWLLRHENTGANEYAKIKTIELSKDVILERSGLLGKYDEFYIFKRDLIDKAVKQINAKTNYTVTTETIKKGRFATGIKFTYIVEQEKKKALKLPPRPRAKQNTELEAQHARECIKLILQHEKQNKALNETELKKLFKYAKVLGDKFLIEDYQAKYSL